MKSDRDKAIAAFNAPPRFVRCPSRKVPWQSQQEAQKEADRLNADPDGHGTNYPYHCEVCGKWHNGRPYKGKALN